MDTFLTFNELTLLIKGDIMHNVPIALFSRPGTGKSSFLKGLADKMDTKVFTIAVNQIADRADLTGVRLVERLTASGEKYYQQEAFPHATLMQAIHYAQDNPDKPTIIFLDEFNRTTPDVTSATLSFTTERKIGTIEFPDNIRFVLAGNKEGNVVPFDDATATRFALYDVKPDHLTFLDANPNLNPFIRDMIIDNKGYLLGEADARSSNATPNPYAANTPDPDEDESDDSSFDPFSEGSGITEDRTVPRTLSMLSNWLNGENLDKSGSADEQMALNEYLQEIEHGQGSHNRPTLLQVAIESKIGKTGTAYELVSRIIEHNKELTKLATASVGNGSSGVTNEFQNILDEIRPSDDMLDELRNMTTHYEIVQLVENMTSDVLSSTMLWLLTNDAYQQLDGDVTPVHIMEEVAQRENDLDVRYSRLFNQILANPDHVVRRSLTVLKDNTPDVNTKINTLVSFAETMID